MNIFKNQMLPVVLHFQEQEEGRMLYTVSTSGSADAAYDKVRSKLMREYQLSPLPSPEEEEEDEFALYEAPGAEWNEELAGNGQEDEYGLEPEPEDGVRDAADSGREEDKNADHDDEQEEFETSGASEKDAQEACASEANVASAISVEEREAASKAELVVFVLGGP
eukprot:CAMPEP_0198224344 /NCGR_PEP_ID=MMETSP1445-20131203/96533_1 /TAXON_ID=36898 /ORGANISM="Pyramimonas sp., Strain CCMP2087" /LENGTH=165 /DNA_ID=CAMNT_0043903485 /DNA_START=11 /DNA_END=504 /DNA_ORIENTATION=+